MFYPGHVSMPTVGEGVSCFPPALLIVLSMRTGVIRYKQIDCHLQELTFRIQLSEQLMKRLFCFLFTVLSWGFPHLTDAGCCRRKQGIHDNDEWLWHTIVEDNRWPDRSFYLPSIYFSFSSTLLSSPSSVPEMWNTSYLENKTCWQPTVQSNSWLFKLAAHIMHYGGVLSSHSRCYQSDLHPFCLLRGCSVTSVRQLRALQERMISMWLFTMRDLLCRAFSLTICSASSFYSCFQVENLHSVVSVHHAIFLH